MSKFKSLRRFRWNTYKEKYKVGGRGGQAVIEQAMISLQGMADVFS